MIEWKKDYSLIQYPDAVKSMEERVEDIINESKNELIWLLEHHHVYTAGISAKNEDLLTKTNIPTYKTNRGGKYTYHGPGIRIMYIMLNLKLHRNLQDIKKFVSILEQTIINILSKFNIKGERRTGRTGIWVTHNNSEYKISAIGIRLRKWVSYHGIAFNINPGLEYFNNIIPCGIKEFGVTSLEKLGHIVSLEQFDFLFQQEFTLLLSKA